jgi:hypothetical protein
MPPLYVTHELGPTGYRIEIIAKQLPHMWRDKRAARPRIRCSGAVNSMSRSDPEDC